MKNGMNNQRESGFTIMEVLVAIVLLAFIGLASARNSIMSMTTLKRSIRNSIATQLAIEKIEELGAVDPTTLDAGDNSTEASIIQDNIEYSRATTVVVNSDQSRSVTVVVTPNDTQLGGSYTTTSRFPLWGNV